MKSTAVNSEPRPAALPLHQLGGPLLRSVSRSFYLTMRALPRPLRAPVSLAYLLARATDTIADTAEISASIRLENLRALADAIARDNAAANVADSIRRAIAPHQQDESERALIEHLPLALRWLGEIGADDRADIRWVLEKITRGQELDVQRFAETSTPVALGTAADLDEYTWLVAGCVGEFWTRLGFRHLRTFAKLPRERMIALGVNYGKGLQLVNVLRDLSADLRLGRCYLPADELAGAGLTISQLTSQSQALGPILSRWQEQAQSYLADGIEYCGAIKPMRVRFASALPALIGARTLALLRKAGVRVLDQKVKVTRHEVRAITLRAAWALASPLHLRRAFAELSREAT